MKKFESFMKQFDTEPQKIQLYEVGLKFKQGKINTNWSTCLIIDKTIFRKDIILAFGKLLTNDESIIQSIVSKFESLKSSGLHGIYFGYEYDQPKELYFDTGAVFGFSYEKQKDNSIESHDWYALTYEQYKEKYPQKISRFEEISDSIDCRPWFVYVKNENGFNMSINAKSKKVCHFKKKLLDFLTLNKNVYELTDEQLIQLKRYFNKRNNYTVEKIAFSKNDPSKLSIYMHGVHHPYLNKIFYFEEESQDAFPK